MTAAEVRLEPVRPPSLTRRLLGLKARLTRSEAGIGYLLASPALFVILAALAVPVGLLVLYSFWTQDYVTLDTTLTLDNYRTIADWPIYHAVMLRSIAIAGIVTVLTVLLAYPLAYYVAFDVTRRKMLGLRPVRPPVLADGPWTDARRDAFVETVLATIESVCPGFRKLILDCWVRTPADLEAEVGLTEGNIFQGELTLDQLLFNRPLPGYAQYRGPVKDFYMCGSSTHSGGGVMGAPGANAAREILIDLKWKRRAT